MHRRRLHRIDSDDSQLALPEFASSTIQAIGKCNTPMTMIIIGLILAKVDVRTICSWTAVYYTVIRLAVIPLLVGWTVYSVYTTSRQTERNNLSI